MKIIKKLTIIGISVIFIILIHFYQLYITKSTIINLGQDIVNGKNIENYFSTDFNMIVNEKKITKKNINNLIIKNSIRSMYTVNVYDYFGSNSDIIIWTDYGEIDLSINFTNYFITKKISKISLINIGDNNSLNFSKIFK